MKAGEVKIAGLSVWQGPRLALDQLTLVAAPGVVTAIVGAAGSGKTSLVQALAGFIKPAAGHIMLDGKNLARVPAHKRGFGVVQQPDILFPNLTLAQNVAFPLRLRGVARRAVQELVANALDLVQLSEVGRLRPAQASAAECQRAMLARATVFGPGVLLLDEPFSAQDISARPALMASLRRIVGLLGCTTILATRHGADALALADHVAILRAGLLEQMGETQDVFNHPRNDHVASLLGEVNRLPGQVEDIEDNVARIRLACGPVVEAELSQGVQLGEMCLVTIRPDRIALAPVPARDMGEHAIDATLLEASFEGDTYRMRLLIGSGSALIVRRPAAAGIRGLEPNAAVSVAWQPHHATAFRAPMAP